MYYDVFIIKYKRRTKGLENAFILRKFEVISDY